MKLKIYQSSEEKLIMKCRENDPASQRMLYDQYASKMLGVCRRYINDADQAEDVMITGFIKVFKNLAQFKFEGSFEGWVRRIMVNESLSFIRKNKNMYLEVDIEYAQREPDYSQLDHHLQAEDLLELIDQLPTGYRTVFNLYAIEGYSHKEIADQLKISENTSKSQLSRARALLQRHLLKSEELLEKKLK
jgi:RNA polymerase sigma-70 factor (ECF subfamily)